MVAIVILKDVKEYFKEYADELQEHSTFVSRIDNNEPVQDILLALYKNTSNRIVMVREVTDDYIKRLINPRFTLTEVLMKQRLKNIYRDLLFIGTMSAMEYNIIRLTIICPKLDQQGKVTSKGGERNIHFSDIIKWNRDKLDDFHLWDFAIKLRNDIVHFDARGRQSMDSPRISFPIIMKEGEEAQGNLRSFISLTRAIENSFFKIIPSLL